MQACCVPCSDLAVDVQACTHTGARLFRLGAGTTVTECGLLTSNQYAAQANAAISQICLVGVAILQSGQFYLDLICVVYFAEQCIPDLHWNCETELLSNPATIRGSLGDPKYI